MGSSISTAKGLHLRAGLCWGNLGSTAALFQDTHEAPPSRVIGEVEAVFQEILDPEGNSVYVKVGSHWDERWSLPRPAKAAADQVTLFTRLVAP